MIDRLLTDEDVDGRGGGGVPDGQPALAARRSRGVVSEQGGGRLAALGEVRDGGVVAAAGEGEVTGPIAGLESSFASAAVIAM